MSELIPVSSRPVAGQSVQSVNARDLHAFLCIGKDFTTWIKDRIDQYGFVEGQDFVTVDGLSSPKSGSAKARPQRVTDYHLALDMAKELSMVERTEKGKEARQYFLECERRAKSIADPMAALSDPATMRTLLLGYTERVLVLEEEVKTLSPKAEALDRISGSDGAMNPTAAAKVLQVPPQRLFNWLRENRWIFRRHGSSANLGYQDKTNAGYLTHKVTKIERPDGSERVVEQVLITAKGIAKLSTVFVASPLI